MPLLSIKCNINKKFRVNMREILNQFAIIQTDCHDTEEEGVWAASRGPHDTGIQHIVTRL